MPGSASRAWRRTSRRSELKRAMSEWWTYRLSDFLLFAPRTYWRQFELLNAHLQSAISVVCARKQQACCHDFQEQAR